MTVLHWASLLSVGLATGVLGGLTGVGGSIVMIPALTELFGPQQHLYQATAMIVNFFVAIPAVYRHRQAKAVQSKVIRLTIPSALLAAAVGVWCSDLPIFTGQGELYLTGLFGLFLFYAAGYQLFDLFSAHHGGNPGSGGKSMTSAWPLVLGLGVPAGWLAGLLGVGGGVVAVPLQQRFFGIPLRNAIANSACTIIGVSALGALLKNYSLVNQHGHEVKESLRLALVLIPTAFVGSYLGSRLTHTLPTRVVSAVFALLLIAGGYRMTSRMW